MYSRGERRRVLRGISRAVPLALAVALIALAGGARAQEGGTAEGAGTEGQPLVTNMFYETSLRQALADIAAQTGTIIVPDMSVQGLVTCELKDVPLDRALEIVLSAGQFEFRHMDGFILVGGTDPESPAFAKLCEARRIKLNYAIAADLVKMLSPSFGAYVKADEATNAVCITAPPKLLERIRGQVVALDRPPRQVMIEAKVVELEERALDRFGVAWSWASDSCAGSFDPVTWTIGLGCDEAEDFTRSVNLTLELLRANESATIIANPHVVAADGTEAEIKVTTEEYFEIVTEDVYVRSELEVIESGIVLTMVPTIGENREITMQVTPDVSNVVGQGTRGLPVITRRRASTTVRVPDGGTIVIAGLIDSRTRVEKLKVPLVGDIPLVKWLFRRESAENQARQVAVFITPRIVEEPTGDYALLSGLPRYRPDFEPVGPEFQAELERALHQH